MYSIDPEVTREEFLHVLEASGLAERRPVDDMDCIDGMLANANLTVSARMNGKLVGISRTVTDFTYAAYLSDLAVDRSLQKSGVGRELVRRTREALGPKCTLILLSAPQAVEYYPRIGFEHHPQAWILPPGHSLKD